VIPRPSIGKRLLVVGAASRDIDRQAPRGWRLGGTVSYAALAAARLGLTVRALVGVDDEARSADELGLLRAAGVELHLYDLRRGPVFENAQSEHGRRQVAHSGSDALPVAALPAAWRETDAALLGPVAGEIGGAWAEAFDRHIVVALALQGVLRTLAPGHPVRAVPLGRDALAARADLLFVSSEDVVAGGVPLHELLAEGQQLFVTHGGHGAVSLRRAAGRLAARYAPPLPRREPVDTTGAGDVFMASYVAAFLAAPALAGTDAEWRLHAVASAAASLNVAAAELDGVPGVADLCKAMLTPRR
jgi:sugar/nucleoside kinase (ribokinase family)